MGIKEIKRKLKIGSSKYNRDIERKSKTRGHQGTRIHSKKIDTKGKKVGIERTF